MENTRVGQIYSTRDYNAFQKLQGNRAVLQRRKNLILTSIRENGWIRNPIVVNEKMEIVDGQGRFEALKQLNMPVEYCISEGSTIKDCVALNLKQKNWGTLDYVQCYADLGNENYIQLLHYIEKYKHLGVEQVCSMLYEYRGVRQGDTAGIRSGNFILAHPETADDRLQFLEKALKLIGKGRGRFRSWTVAMRFIYACPAIDNDRMLEALGKNIALLDPCIDAATAVRSLERVYNYGIRGRVYFIPEYDRYRYSYNHQTMVS